MADKVYYRVKGKVMVEIPVIVELTVRTEDESIPGKALTSYLKKGTFQHSQGDIEDVTVGINFHDGADVEHEISEMIKEHCDIKWKDYDAEVIDAK